jgi:hypothetical protein
MNQQISTLEEREKAIESKREHKADTRRPMVVGAVVKAKVEQAVIEEAHSWGWLDGALSRPDDRALFTTLCAVQCSMFKRCTAITSAVNVRTSTKPATPNQAA